MYVAKARRPFDVVDMDISCRSWFVHGLQSYQLVIIMVKVALVPKPKKKRKKQPSKTEKEGKPLWANPKTWNRK